MPNNETTIKQVSIEDANEYHIILADSETLLSKETAVRLARYIAARRESRRSIPDWIAKNIYREDVRIFSSSGAEFDFDCDAIDTAFNEDGSFRWISDFVKFATKAPRQKLQDRVLERIRLIEAATAFESLMDTIDPPFHGGGWPPGAHDWVLDSPVIFNGIEMTIREYKEYKKNMLHRKILTRISISILKLLNSIIFISSLIFCTLRRKRFTFIDYNLPLNFKVIHFFVMTR